MMGWDFTLQTRKRALKVIKNFKEGGKRHLNSFTIDLGCLAMKIYLSVCATLLNARNANTLPKQRDFCPPVAYLERFHICYQRLALWRRTEPDSPEQRRIASVQSSVTYRKIIGPW